MTKINREEYQALKNLGDQWKWIARDSGGNRVGNLFAYSEKPFKYGVGVWDYGRGVHHIDNHLFQFIRWEDEEPYSIQELIEGYEHSAEHVSHVLNERVKALGEAWSVSEETETKKDKEWLLDTFRSRQPFNNNFSKGYVLEKVKQLDDTEITLDRAFEKVAESYSMTKEKIWLHLEQLEAHGGEVTYGEQEVLSQEWINENEYIRMDPDNPFVYVKDLQNLLVPKQEEITEEQAMDWLDHNNFYDHRTAETVLERAVDKGELSYYGTKYAVIEKPVVPKFIADYLPLVKRDIELEKSAYYATTNNELPKWKKEYDWIRANFETFVRAWLAYPNIEVEEEPKYYVLNTEGETMIRKSDSRVRTSSGFKIRNGFEGENYKFTEQEIKDYDPRFWPFAVKVEELEEND